MPQWLNRVHAGRAPRWKVPKHNTIPGRKHHRQQVDRRIKLIGHRHVQRQAIRSPGGNQHPDHTAQRRQHHRFYQKLQQHLAFQRTDSQAQANLAGGLVRCCERLAAKEPKPTPAGIPRNSMKNPKPTFSFVESRRLHKVSETAKAVIQRRNSTFAVDRRHWRGSCQSNQSREHPV